MLIKREYYKNIEIHLLNRKIGWRNCFLGYRFGSLNTTFKNNTDGTEINLPFGTAHFVEHRMFYDESGNNKEFINLYPNIEIYTNQETTCYSFKCMSPNISSFYKKFNVLLDFISNKNIESIGNEIAKSEVLKEIRIQDKKLSNIIHKYTLKNLYGNHPIGLDVLGNEESVSKIDIECLKFCFDEIYIPSNMFIVLDGELDISHIKEIIDKKITSISPVQRYKPILFSYPQTAIELISFVPLNIEGYFVSIGVRKKIKDGNKIKGYEIDVYIKLLYTLLTMENSPVLSSLREENIIIGKPKIITNFVVDDYYVYVYFQVTSYKKWVKFFNNRLFQLMLMSIKEDVIESEKERIIINYKKFRDEDEKFTRHYVKYFINDITVYCYEEILRNISIEELRELILSGYDRNDITIAIFGKKQEG